MFAEKLLTRSNNDKATITKFNIFYAFYFTEYTFDTNIEHYIILYYFKRCLYQIAKTRFENSALNIFATNDKCKNYNIYFKLI